MPHGKAFSGFGDDIVIIVASALVVSAAVKRSSVVKAARSHQVTSVQGQVAVLVAAVTVLSAFVKSPFMRMT